MTWPPQSPDLNLIKLRWEGLDREVRKSIPKSSPTLWEQLQGAWSGIEPLTLAKRLKIISKLCHKVIKAKSRHIDEYKIEMKNRPNWNDFMISILLFWRWVNIYGRECMFMSHWIIMKCQIKFRLLKGYMKEIVIIKPDLVIHIRTVLVAVSSRWKGYFLSYIETNFVTNYIISLKIRYQTYFLSSTDLNKACQKTNSPQQR